MSSKHSAAFTGGSGKPRLMAETAALLADDVLPGRPLRQWVLSLPHARPHSEDSSIPSTALPETPGGGLAVATALA